MESNKKNNPTFIIGLVLVLACFFIYFIFFYENTSSLGEGIFSGAKKEKGIIINEHTPQKLNWIDSFKDDR